MKYIKTNRVTLVDTMYPSTIIFEQRDRDFYTNCPVPKNFIVPIKRVIGASAFQTLAIWYVRGCALHFGDVCLMHPNPKEAWEYRFVSAFPQYYIKKGATTPDKAYALGQQLIDACKKASQIPFSMLEDAYKDILRLCIELHIKAYSPNEKTYLEVSAEQNLNRELEILFDSSAVDRATVYEKLPENLDLTFYARVFDIQLPEWYICQSNIKTKHGYATCPYIADKPNYNLKNNTYAGNLDANGNIDNTPMTLRRDAIPYRAINEQVEFLKLAEMVLYYLSLPIKEQRQFFADNYDYCPKCHEYFAKNDGCSCGYRPPYADRELRIINKACAIYARTH